MHSADDLVMCLGDLNGHIDRHIDGFDGLHGLYGDGQKNLEGRMLLEFCLEKELCVLGTWFKREEKRKVTFRMGENETEIDFVLLKKECRWFLRNVKAFSFDSGGGRCCHREGVLGELCCADYLVLISEIIEELGNYFIEWMEAF